MDSDDDGLGPSFFEDRLLIEIEAWDCSFHVGLRRRGAHPHFRFLGGLTDVRSLSLTGRMLAPAQHRDRSARVWVSPYDRESWSGPEALDEVGRVYWPAAGEGRFDISLMIPQDALVTVQVCMGSIWKYVHVWTFDADAREASVRDFSFSATVADKVKPWAGLD
ncbi:MAG TPA: hypothetical protein VG939_05010 [Caulobacteraceae bacterium]|nr:hypothetical protein [Caulobacteraceae bacterium]